MSSVDISELADKICQLDLLSVVKLMEKIEEKTGISISSVPAAATSPAENVGDEATKQNEFTLTIDSYLADKKISLIKVVREIMGLGLKEAKEFVEKDGSKDITDKNGNNKFKKEDAEKNKEKLEAAGAKVTMK